MKKSKRILSMLTALAITASAFASMVIPASAADTTYFTVDFSSPTSTGITAQGKEGQGPVAYGDYLTFSMGARDKGGDNTSNIAIDDGALKITSGGYASSTRGGSIAFSSTAGVPAFASIDAGNVLEIAFDAKYQDAASTIQMFGITSDTTTTGGQAVNDPYLSVANNAQIPTNEWIKVKVSVANDKKAYATITDADGKLISAKDFTASGDSFEKFGFYGAATAVWIDNLSVKQVANTYKNLTVNVADSKGAAVKNTTIKVDKAEQLLENGGSITLALPAGTYAIEASAPGYEANAGQKDAATDSAVIDAADVTKNLVIDEQSYTHEPKTVNVVGGQPAMTAPRTADTLASNAFTVESVIDQNDVDRTSEATIAWSIEPADANVTIANGVVTVKKGFTAGETHVKDFTVKATASMQGTDVTAVGSKTISVSDYYFYEPGVDVASYGGVIRTLQNGEKTITNPVDATTETIAIPEEVTFTKGTAQTLSYKAMFSDVGYYTYARYLTITDTEGNTVIGPVYMSGPKASAGMVIGTAPSFTKDVGPDWADQWYTFDTNTWITVNMMFITYSSGAKKVKVSVEDGEEFIYDIDDKVTGIKNINLTTANAFNGRLLGYKDFVIEEADVSGIDIAGPAQFTSIPGNTITKEYNVEAIMIDEGENFVWTKTGLEGATLTADPSDSSKAILTVPDTVTAGGTITATSTKTPSKTKTIDVDVAKAVATSYKLEGSKAIHYDGGDTVTEAYTLTDVKDQNGDDITDYVNPVWSLKGREAVTLPNATFTVDASAKGDAVAIFPTYDGTTLTGITTAPVKITDTTVKIEGKNGQKVLLWNSLTEMESLAPAGTITGTDITDANYITNTGELNINVEQDETVVATILGDQAIEQPVKVAMYYMFGDYTEAGDTIDISDLVTDDAITGYQVTVAKNNEQLSQTVVAKTDVTGDSITLPTVADADGAEVEIAPVFTYTTDLSDVSTTPYSALVPNGSYSMDFEKVTTTRCDLKINGYIVIEEAGMGGNGRGVSATRTYSTSHVIVNKGEAVIGASGTCNLASVKIVKEPDIVKRKTHIWIGGDSTVCRYDGNEETGDVKDMQTGWGQVIGTYLDDSVVISDLAESGSYIHRWIGEEYPTVRDMIQPGDYFIIQMGINDRSHTDVTNEADMKKLLGQMVDEVRAKGGIPVLITPQKSVGYAWYSTDSTKGDVTTWNGAGISWSSYSWGTGVMKSVAEEKGTLFVDNASMSAEAFFNLGKDYVVANFHLSNEFANEGKCMHWSYAGAQKIASMIAQSIYDQKKAGTKTSSGESFDGIPVITTGSGFTFTDSNGTSQTYNVVDLAN